VITINRGISSTIPFIYALYLPIQSLFVTGFGSRYLEMIALAIYLYSCFATLILFKGLDLPRAQAISNMVCAGLVPALVIAQRVESNNQGVGGWVVMGTAVFLTATAVRQRVTQAVIGLVLLLGTLIVEYGVNALTSAGLAGAFVFVFAGLAVSRGIARASKDSQKFRATEVESLSNIAKLKAADQERQTRLGQVLGSAVPLLSVIAQSSQPLDSEIKQSAKLVEATLRDRMRGRDLLTAAMSVEVQRLRSIGVEVIVLDEGGTEDLSSTSRDEILDKAITALQEVDQGRVTIRSPKGEEFRLTVVATISGQAKPLLSLRL
jgi:hypothetical protein